MEKITNSDSSASECLNSSVLNDQTLFFSPIRTEHPNMQSTLHHSTRPISHNFADFKDKIDKEFDPHYYRASLDYGQSMPGHPQLKQRANSVTDGNMIKNLQFENNMARHGSHVYNSSREFLANLDRTSPLHQAEFATSHNQLANLESKFQKKAMSGNNLLDYEIVEDIHEMPNENIFTILGRFR